MKWAVAIGILLAGVGVFYYLAISKPELDSQKFEYEKQQLKDSVSSRTTCLAQAEQVYTSNWERSCSTRGLGSGCLLPSNDANNIEGIRKESQDNCFKLYPAN